MRLDPAALRDTLERCALERQSVLMFVAVLGGTEYGTIDPIDAVLAARDDSRRRGLVFSLHVVAAWRVFLASLFRHVDGSPIGISLVLIPFTYSHLFCLFLF